MKEGIKVKGFKDSRGQGVKREGSFLFSLEPLDPLGLSG
jgi:hypothetical protein